MPDPQFVGRREVKTRLVFPTDLSRIGSASASEAPNIPYIQFTAYKWNIDKNAKKDQSIFIRNVSRGSCVLPLSEQLNDVQNINWETAEGLGAKNITELGFKQALNFIRNLSGSAAKFVEAKSGKTVNDLQSLSFGLTDFRNWSFSFKLMPKGQRDSQRLAEIIQFFKTNTIADFTGNLIDYPSFFTVRVHFPTGESGTLFEKLMIFKAAVVTNVSVNYLDGGQSFYRDGAPTSVIIDLTLKELERVSRREYNLGLR
jgi:hypothetical protein